MNKDWFKLRPLPPPRLNEQCLNTAVSRLAKITEGWEAGELNSSTDLVKDLRERITDGYKRGLSFQKCTAVKRREWLLLCLYLNELASNDRPSWLPEFDEAIAVSLLGRDSRGLKQHLRRLATQLYFTHFGHEKIPCLDWLSSLLRHSWRMAVQDRLDPQCKVWAKHADILFGPESPDRVSAQWIPGMSVEDLAARFALYQGGLFRERLLQSLILRRLREAPLDKGDPELNNLVHAERKRRLVSGQCLGAESVRILIDRVKHERGSVVPEAWTDQLVSFACDPRTPNQEEQFRWWGWATPPEKDIAIRALSKITLEEFIRLLDNSLSEQSQRDQFERRKALILKLYEKGHVIEARLVVARNIYRNLDKRTRDILCPSWLAGSGDTSVICLRCVDNVFLIEGTHSFSLRGFLGADRFPIRGYWESAPREFSTSQFRVYEGRCQIYQKHQGPRWEWSFLHQLVSHGVPWTGIQ
jgi:hypothetical protein